MTVLEYMDHVSVNLEETTLTLSFSPNGFGSGEVIVSASDVLKQQIKCFKLLLMLQLILLMMLLL